MEEFKDENSVEEGSVADNFGSPDSDTVTVKKKKRVRFKDMSPEQKKKKRIKDVIITACVFGFAGLFIAVVALAGFLGVKTNMTAVEAFTPVQNAGLTPVVDPDTGYWTFTTDGDFKVMQLTDVHIGGGAFSINKDNWALNAVYKLISEEKPDLVIITGDIAYPVGFQSGSFNNVREAELFASAMEQIGVYWAIAFGNHDTEAYSMADREDISNFYSQEKWKHCLFQAGPSDVDGFGNYFVNVKNSKGIITQSFIMLDSHSYTDGDIWGAAWKYDNIHQNQIDWYKAQITALNNANHTTFQTLSAADKAAQAELFGVAVDSFDSTVFQSMAFFHIPLVEYRTAWNAYVDNGYKNTDTVTYNFGVAGESGKVVFCGMYEDNLFETIQELKSTQAIFCGHDHLNNFSITYSGATADGYAVRLTYGMSIDYLAYAGIQKKTEQRGGTLITVKPNGNFELAQCRLSDYKD